MTTTVITPDFVCPVYPLVVVAGFNTTLSCFAPAGGTVLVIPVGAAAELSAAIGSSHTYVTVSDACGAEDVEVWFDGPVLRCTALAQSKVVGSCVRGDSHPIAVYCVTKAAVGSSPADGYYSHTQTVAAGVWVVTHNLSRVPHITVLDTNGNVVLAEVTHNSVNTVTVTFDQAELGSVICS